MTPIQSLRDKAKAAVEGLAAYRANPNINTSKTSMLATAQFKKAAGDPILILSLIEALEKAARELAEAREALKPFADAYVNREKWAEDSYIGGSDLRNRDLRRAARAYANKGEPT